MRRHLAFAFAFAFAARANAPQEPLVLAQDQVPGLIENQRYATADNFLHEAVYPKAARCLLRRSVAERLSRVAKALATQGYRLEVFDCYRPRSVQWRMWKLFPKPGYVANPKYGSNHNRGGAVDLTLATLDGGAVEMPTPFDTFDASAHHGYDGGTPASREHREVLRAAMEAEGFTKNRMEWWHYDAPGSKAYEVLDQPFTSDGGI